MVFGGKKYKLTLLGGEEIIFNTLSATTSDQVFAGIKDSNEDPELVEHIFNQVTEDRYKGEDFPAGIIVLTVYLSLKTSGVLRTTKDLPDIYEQSRLNVQRNLFYTFYAEILKHFHSYKLEELKQKSILDIFELIAIIEKMTGQELFDLTKMKASVSGEAAKPKGVAAITKDELDLIKNILADQEARADGMPNVGF